MAIRTTLLVMVLISLYQSQIQAQITENQMRINALFDSTLTQLEPDYPWAVPARMPNGRIALVTHDNTTAPEIYVSVINNDGSLQWEDNIIYGGVADYGVDVKVDDNNNIFVLATGKHAVLENDVLLYKLDANGNQQWSFNWDGGDSLIDAPSAMKLDADGSVYITGFANQGNESVTSDEDHFMLKVNPDGTLAWSQIYDFNDFSDVGVDLLIDQDYVYAACNS